MLWCFPLSMATEQLGAAAIRLTLGLDLPVHPRLLLHPSSSHAGL